MWRGHNRQLQNLEREWPYAVKTAKHSQIEGSSVSIDIPSAMPANSSDLVLQTPLPVPFSLGYLPTTILADFQGRLVMLWLRIESTLVFCEL